MGKRFSSYFPLLICMLLAACGSPDERAANYLEKAEKLYEQGDDISARIEAMNAAQIEPRNADVRYLLARIEEREGNIPKAAGHLQVAIDSDPNHLKSRIMLGNYYVLAKNADRAAEQADAAINLAPDNAEVRLLQARVHLLNQELDQAAKLVDSALAIDPKLIDAIIFKAGLITADGDTDSALQLIQDAMSWADENETEQLRRFRILLLSSADRYDEIETDLKKLIADYPDNVNYLLSLANLYVTQGRTDEAEAIYRKYVSLDLKDVDRRIAFARFIAAQHGPEAAEKLLQEYAGDLPEALKLQLTLGLIYEENDKQEQALSTYEKIAQTNAKSESGLAARNRIALIRLKQNRPDEAREIVESIIADDPINEDALMVRAAFSYSEKKYADAVIDLRTVLRQRPKSERALLLLARSHNAANNPELAQDAYRRLIEVDPNHPFAATELAEMIARSGDVPKAEEILREQLASVPEDRRAGSSLIQALLMQGNLEEAETQARTMLDLGDETGLADFELGRVLQAKKDDQEAIDAYKTALEKSPAAPEPLQGLISILVSKGKADEAVAYLQERIDRYPTQLVPRMLLASVYAKQEKIDKAADLYEEVISLQPRATRAYASLASLYPDDSAKRNEIYRRSIAANPDDPVIQLLLASDYERAGKIEEALEIYENILAKNPKQIIAANNLASLMLDYRTDAESHARALDLARSFEDSDQAALLDTLGWAYYRSGDYENAIRVLEKAINANDRIGLLHYHLGMGLIKSGLVKRGRDELEKSLDLSEDDFPGIDEARATLEQLEG